MCLLSEAPASNGATTPGALLLGEQDGSNAVVHLVIQRSAQVGTHVLGGCFHHCLHASFGVLLLDLSHGSRTGPCEQLCAANSGEPSLWGSCNAPLQNVHFIEVLHPAL